MERSSNADGAKAGSVDIDPTVSVWIGAKPNDVRVFDGRIDDVKIFLRGLDAIEIGSEMGVPVQAR